MDDLIVSLRKEPSPEEHALASGVGLHSEAHVPFRMFAKVALRQDQHASSIGDMDGMRKWFRRRAWALILAFAANALGVGGYAVHRIRSAGAEEQRELDQGRDIMRMEQDIRDLRRICGLDSGVQTIVQLGP